MAKRLTSEPCTCDHRVQVMQPQPGDILVINTPDTTQPLDEGFREAMRELKGKLSLGGIVYLTGDINLTLIRKPGRTQHHHQH